MLPITENLQVTKETQGNSGTENNMAEKCYSYSIGLKGSLLTCHEANGFVVVHLIAIVEDNLITVADIVFVKGRCESGLDAQRGWNECLQNLHWGKLCGCIGTDLQ